MPQDIKFLLVFLIIVLAVLIYLQNQQCNAIPNDGKLSKRDNFVSESDTTDDNLVNFKRNMLSKNKEEERYRPKYNNMNNRDKLVNNILRNTRMETVDQELDSLIDNESASQETINSEEPSYETSRGPSNDLFNGPSNDLSNGPSNRSSNRPSRVTFENPMDENINKLRDNLSSSDLDSDLLGELIKEVNTGNDLQVNSTQNEIFQNRSRSINSAKNYRKVSYADSEYRYNFNGNESNSDFSELNQYTDEANDILNNKQNNNSGFKGYPDGNINFTKNDNNMSVRGFLNDNELYGNADLKNFSNNKPESQQEKVMNLYNSDSYLPNDKYLSKDLTKGFQILENPVSVNNPNLIPVLKSIPVSSVLGSNRNSTYDIRSEPPNPKTVVSPFLNSSIMPDIYATNRGCL
jgi:hypothetical protein